MILVLLCYTVMPMFTLQAVIKKWKIETSKDAMTAPLKNDKWPDGIIDINGPTF